ncbi:sensor domain-containing protein [Gorillibacterium timonense]|uniref:sensor domain-containing protein n=1 Tax=Gorillibacterium timonense TaxID=1689269 RepID=UPI00071DFEC1|nr:sensor domain-containing protein [Gorillibacterium timonense]
MKKQSTLQSWTLLMLSLPKGIVAFVIAITGICVSLPLIIVWIGIPLLAATLAACSRMMKNEQSAVSNWIRDEELKPEPAEASVPFQWGGWRSLFSLLGQSQTYRGLLYSVAQLPIGITGFTLAVVLPATAFGILLSPIAYWVSDRFFSFDLFSYDSSLLFLLPDLSSSERSWAAAGIGLVMVLLLPLVLKGLGRLYASWVQLVARA